MGNNYFEKNRPRFCASLTDAIPYAVSAVLNVARKSEIPCSRAWNLRNLQLMVAKLSPEKEAQTASSLPLGQNAQNVFFFFHSSDRHEENKSYPTHFEFKACFKGGKIATTDIDKDDHVRITNLSIGAA